MHAFLKTLYRLRVTLLTWLILACAFAVLANVLAANT